MRRSLLFSFFSLFLLPAMAQVTAAFWADEGVEDAYYSQGWDSGSEASTWSYDSTSSSTWEVGMVLVPFSTIDAGSVSSLVLKYNSGQHEVATSPEIEILPGSELEFYCYAKGIFLVYGSWKLYAIDDGNTAVLVDQFQWAQDRGYDGPSWEKFTVDLGAYAGKRVKFSFVYDGNYGEDEAIDGFKLFQRGSEEAFSVTIKEGEQVHFHDVSTGDVSGRRWTFAGGAPDTSTDKDPVVTYDEAGEYSVRLEVWDGGSSTSVKEGSVIVKAEPPVARIGLPAQAYLSPYVAAFVPTDVDLQFEDASTGNPLAWEWTFEGGSPSVSTEKNPVVRYADAGTYSVSLNVSNDKGSSQDVLKDGLQVGGVQYIWNILPEEKSSLSLIEMGWFGNYGGTNWLGMSEFAEHFDAPLAKAAIERVAVYFGKTTAVTTDADITLSIRYATEDGLPGSVIASKTLKASELVSAAEKFVETSFTFDSPVMVEDEFFVSVGGFPNENGDDIAMLLMRRGEGEKCTGYQFVMDEGEDYNYLDTGTWYKNTDSPLSLAIAPILNYDSQFTGIVDKSFRNDEMISIDGDVIRAHEGVKLVSVYDMNGCCIGTMKDGGMLPMDGMGHGIYIVRAVKDGKSSAKKIVR